MAEHHVERIWDPRRWDRSNRILVGGELAAFAAAILAMILDFPAGDAGKWCLYLTAAIAAGTLAGYAMDRSSHGDKPLTGIETRRIAHIAQLVALKDRAGVDIDWNTVTSDGRQAKASMNGLPIAVKRAVVKSAVESNLPAGFGAVEVASKAVDEMTDSEIAELFAAAQPGPVNFHL